jgi:hypothetical protein
VNRDTKQLRIMRKSAIVVLLALLIASCYVLGTQATLDRTTGIGRPYLQVELVYNYDVYQRPVFFMPKSNPTFSIWVEDDKSGYRESVFVTEKAAKNDWHFAESRPEAIPVWYGIQKLEIENHTFDVDAVSGATPKGKTTVIYWSVPEALQGKTVDLYIEANNSFDFNTYYNKKKGTPGYSGANGQPSVIWKASIDFSSKPFENVSPEIVGHGNLFGEDHQVSPDTSKITTAAKTFQAIRISYFLQ